MRDTLLVATPEAMVPGYLALLRRLARLRRDDGFYNECGLRLLDHCILAVLGDLRALGAGGQARLLLPVARTDKSVTTR